MKNVTKNTLIAAWPLFFGITFIAAANGLQGTLLSLRASLESFPVFVTGLIMSCYYAGFLGGSFIAPRMVQRVGHIRVFAAMASLSSATILLHGLFVDEIIWAAMRVVTGIAYAGMYVVAESWMNDISNNKNRGFILSTYMTINHAAFFVSQFMLGIAPPEAIGMYILISIMVSLALLPVVLIPRAAPTIDHPHPIAIKELFKASPTGILTVFSNGIIGATMVAIGPLYFLGAGLKVSSIGIMISAYILGGLIGQIPMGMLSDFIPRRLLLLAMLAISCASSIVFYLLHTPDSSLITLYIVLTCLGITSNTIHAVAVAYTNDALKPEQYVSASAALIMINGFGTFIGPLSIAGLMTILGNETFFLQISIVFATIFCIASFRAVGKEIIPVEDQSDHISMPQRGTMITAQIAEED